MPKFRFSRGKVKGSRGCGGVQKGNWRRTYDSGSLHHNRKYHIQKAMANSSSTRPILNTSISQISSPQNEINTTQVISETSKIKPIITSMRVPFAYAPKETQYVPAWRLYELFREGNFRLLKEIIMKKDSHLILGRISRDIGVNIQCTRKGLNCYSLKNDHLDLAMLYLNANRYLGLYLPKTDVIYLIISILKENTLLLAKDRTEGLSSPKYLSLRGEYSRGYNFKDLSEWYNNLPKTLSFFVPDERYVPFQSIPFK